MCDNSKLAPSPLNHQTGVDNGDMVASPAFHRLQSQLRTMRRANQVLEDKLSSDTNIIIDNLRNELRAKEEERAALERELSNTEQQKVLVSNELNRWHEDDEVGVARVEKLKSEIAYLQRHVQKLQHDVDRTRGQLEERDAFDVRMYKAVGSVWTSIKTRVARSDGEDVGEADVADIAGRLIKVFDGIQRENNMLRAARENVVTELDEMADSMEVLFRDRDVAQRAREADERKATVNLNTMKRQLDEANVTIAGLEERAAKAEREAAALRRKALRPTTPRTPAPKMK